METRRSGSRSVIEGPRDKQTRTREHAQYRFMASVCLASLASNSRTRALAVIQSLSAVFNAVTRSSSSPSGVSASNPRISSAVFTVVDAEDLVAALLTALLPAFPAANNRRPEQEMPYRVLSHQWLRQTMSESRAPAVLRSPGRPLAGPRPRFACSSAIRKL